MRCRWLEEETFVLLRAERDSDLATQRLCVTHVAAKLDVLAHLSLVYLIGHGATKDATVIRRVVK